MRARMRDTCVKSHARNAHIMVTRIRYTESSISSPDPTPHSLRVGSGYDTMELCAIMHAMRYK